MPQWRKFHLKTIDSLDVNAMPDDFSRYQWALLSLIVDKEGRGIYKGSWLKSKMYPMRDNISVAKIMKSMEWCFDRGMIGIYSENGQEYFYIIRWHEYQDTTKEGRSQLPQPTESNSRPTPEKLQSNSVTEKNRVEKSIPGAKKTAPTNPELTSLADLFSTLTGLPKPDWPTLTERQRKQAGVRWAAPLQGFLKLANGSASEIMREAIRRQKSDRLDISAPASIEKKFQAVYSERHSKIVSPTPDL